MTPAETVNSVIQASRAAFAKNPNPSLGYRKDRLRALADITLQNRQRIRDALRADYVRHPDPLTDFVEVAAVPARCHQAITELENWTRPDPRPLDTAMFGTANAWMEWQPKGVVGNIVPWNFPFELGLSPLAEVLAAGNRAVIKPSELAPASADLLAEMIATAFDKDEVTAVLGGPDVAEAFAAAPWDHLLFTGSTENGRRVMALAAPNLTPLTLELGGKCPAVIGTGGISRRTLEAVLGLKLAKAGQICVSADYILVPRTEMASLINDICAYADEFLADFSRGSSITGIISERHFDRLISLLKDAEAHGAQIIALDDADDDRANRLMPLRLIVDPPENARVLTEEVFGPILPIVPYDGIDDAIARINAAGSPLGIYVFSDDQAEIDAVISRTRSGGVTVNGAALHSASPNLGFGGVGASGFGRHHGIEGFRSFSNHRAVLVRGPEDATHLIFPPYGPDKFAAAEAAFAGL